MLRVFLAQGKPEFTCKLEGGRGAWGAAWMQGWRPTMEDAHCAVELGTGELTVYGVFERDRNDE